MKIRLTAKADKDYARLPLKIRKALAKQFDFLLSNLYHPSLRAKKYSGTGEVWQCRVNRDWRFYLKIERDEYVILSIIPHPK